MGSKKIKLLLIEDDQIDQMAFKKFVKKANLPYDYFLAGSIQEAISLLQSKNFDIIVSDYLLGDGIAFDLFEYIHDIPMIIVTGTGDEEIAVQAMKTGASDYLIKDPAGNYLKILPVTVEQAFKHRQDELELSQYHHHIEELVQDRTAKLRQEIEKRQEIEDMLRVKDNAIESSVTAIGIAMLDGQIEYVNPAYVKLYGYDNQNEIIGMSITDFGYPKEAAQHVIQQVNEKGYFWGEGLGIRKNGSFVHLQIGVNLVRDAAGMPIRILATFIDISERKNAEAALRQSEDKYRSIFENIQDVYYEVTFDGTILELSPSIELLSHYSRKELIGKSLTQIYADPTERYAFLATIQKTGQVNDYEITLQDKNGVSVPCSISAKLHTDDAGKPAKIIGIMHDISERKKTEARLRLLFSAVEQSSEGIAVSDLDGNLQFTNHAFAGIHGYTPEELLGKHLAIFHTAEQLPAVENANRQVMEIGWFSGEIWHVKRDGTVFPSMMHNSLLRDLTGKPIGRIGLMRDITEAKQAEVALRESEERFRVLFESAPLGYQSLDEEGNILTVNETWCDVLGYGKEEVIGRNFSEFLTPKSKAQFTSNFSRFKKAGEIRDVEFDVVKKDGKKVIIRFDGKIAHSLAGTFKQIHCILNDITERKKAEKALKESERRLSTLMSNLPGMAYRCRNDRDWTM